MEPLNDIVIGLGFGDEGKGATVDYLASQRSTNAVIRFSGGAQTAHNVVTPNGVHHTFQQFGSGTFHGVRTILTKHVLVQPFNLVQEGLELITKAKWDVLKSLLISETALMTTPIHQAVNRKREQLRGNGAHGSCGLGVGETQFYANQHPAAAITMGDMGKADVMQQKLTALLQYAINEVGEISHLCPPIEDLMTSYAALHTDQVLNIVSDNYILEEIKKGYNIWEGSQGVLLDEDLGFHPHTTWSTTTQDKAQKILTEADMPAGRVIGCIRSYNTRHGNGPLPTEGSFFTEEEHNSSSDFAGVWRAGLFDFPLFDYAVRANKGVDVLSVSHMDKFPHKAVLSYPELPFLPDDFYGEDWGTKEEVTEALKNVTGTGYVSNLTVDQFISKLENNSKSKVLILGNGQTWLDRELKP